MLIEKREIISKKKLLSDLPFALSGFKKIMEISQSLSLNYDSYDIIGPDIVVWIIIQPTLTSIRVKVSHSKIFLKTLF